MKVRLLLISAFFAQLALAQEYKNVEIGSSSIIRRGLCEPSITISKQNPDIIVAAAILDNVFYSNDGGLTWTNDTIKSTYGVWGDPVLVAGNKGEIYFLHLSDPTGENWKSEEILDRIVCQRSDDGGKTWNNGGYMGLAHPKDQDKQWAITNLQTGTIYSTWTQFDKYGSSDSTMESNIMFSKSEDQGENWTEAMDISQIPGGCLDDDNTTEGAVPAVSPDGDIYVAWSNKGEIFFDKSSDDGQTWLEEDLVVDQHFGGWEIEIPGLQRANGMPVTVCDVSEGPYRGNIYITWVDDRDGNYDVWFKKSSDKGETWSETQKINNDDSQMDQFFSWTSCDPVTGYLYTIFYDRRNYDDWQTDVYMAISKDGGESWKNMQISEEPFTPSEKVFFGDYNNIDAHGGIVRPIWTRMDGLKMGIWTALINDIEKE